MLLAQAGCQVTFVDVDEQIVNLLNRERSYPVRIVSGEGSRETQVEGVTAVNGKDEKETAMAIAEADLLATAVGVNVLKYIIPNLAAGIRERMRRKRGPLNIIICENLMDANLVLKEMVKGQLTESEQEWVECNIGFVEASVGRMVPVQTDAMKDPPRELKGVEKPEVTAAIQAEAAKVVPLPEPRPAIAPVSTKPQPRHLRRHRYYR